MTDSVAGRAGGYREREKPGLSLRSRTSIRAKLALTPLGPFPLLPIRLGLVSRERWDSFIIPSENDKLIAVPRRGRTQRVTPDTAVYDPVGHTATLSVPTFEQTDFKRTPVQVNRAA